MPKRSTSPVKRNEDSDNHPKFAFIDALRGYAVLLVITSHTGEVFPLLPYPLRRLTNFGYNGVQLFFLLSCLTLLLSWRSEEAKGPVNLLRFWGRRLFRIAPMYYLAGLYYFLTEPPDSGFDAGQLAATLTFTNVWHPLLVPTVPDRWKVVPGGWTIGVEFTFYLLFPLMAASIRSLRSALFLTLASIAAGIAANTLMADHLQPTYSRVAVENFLFFWFPNQMPVFALGTVLYILFQRARMDPRSAARLQAKGMAVCAELACGAACLSLAYVALPNRLSLGTTFLPPGYLCAAALFLPLILVMGLAPATLLTNKLIRRLGQVSFSAYLIHFSVLHALVQWLPRLFDTGAQGWRAILLWAVLWAATLALTFGLSLLTFSRIETTMIVAGRRLLDRPRNDFSGFAEQ